jgi:hypothetical protein
MVSLTSINFTWKTKGILRILRGEGVDPCTLP